MTQSAAIPGHGRAGPTVFIAALVVPALWGIYWVPLRALEAVAAAGPWATFVAVAVGALAMAPFAWVGRRRIRASNPWALVSIGIGGVSFILYSNGLLYGHVAVVILLFYLTPVWSVIIARLWLGWPASWWRYAAIGLGLGGIALVLRGSHGGLPLPTTLGDWFGLASGIMWSISSTGLRTQVATNGVETNFIFCLGGAVAALVLALGLGGSPPPLPDDAALEALAWIAALGVGWWGVSLAVFMWVARLMEPTRLGILMMTEAIVGTLSAAIFTAEPFGWIMAVGAALVVLAAYLETRHEAPAA
ncbi:EamA domain-containing membrane protein RarD [Limimonas halophila]|uniref:EamA domain-containing membrane protein RarD n=1 Tax=Limimonas halophila TaxID=1082479 RepID=A0A1G7L9D8_9PROT|nr:DMT family transporter [Limimonas halophila]SDF45914.1 EamA domain-containing membrane protein RarD [Limimonas halophila]